MRILFLLLLAYSLQAESFWNLTGLQKANIYVKNEVSYLEAKTVSDIKEKMKAVLKKNAIVTGQQDSPILIISLEEISTDESHYVYVKLALGEEAQTYREDKSSTFAYTYVVTDFVELDAEELDSGVLESADFLLSQFSEHYEDDKE